MNTPEGEIKMPMDEMQKPETTAQRQAVVIQYLYGDMSDADKQLFQQWLAAEPALSEMLEEEEQLQALVPIGTRPFIDEQRLQANRWLLQRRLQSNGGSKIAVWAKSLFHNPMRLAFQGAAMAATFVLGLMVANDPVSTLAPSDSLAINEDTSPLPLSLIGDDDYEIFEFGINDYDANTGDIDLTYSVASKTRLTGNVKDAQINSLMAEALQNDIASGARIDTVSVLSTVMTGPQIMQAMVHVLRNDPNPGVRYEAVQSLVALADDPSVREVLRGTLREDVNPGIRLAAFDALSAYSEEDDTRSVLLHSVENDGNDYIRAQAQQLLGARSDSNAGTIEL